MKLVLPPYDPVQAEAWMRRALELARGAAEQDEVPVGAIVLDATGRELAAAHDARQHGADPLAHAEWIALRQAAAAQGDWRLDGMTLVVTLEPCPMCAGALLMARIGRVIFGAASNKWGAAGTRADWLGSGVFPHRPEVVGGVLADSCAEVLSAYFRRRRTGPAAP